MNSINTYRRLTAFFILAAVLAQSVSRPFIVADYYANTNAYAKNCINKARPKMHCNGKCQMMKKIQEQEKKDQENQERKSENKTEILLSSKSFFASLNLPVTIIIELDKISPRSNGISTDRSLDIFHPPQA